MRAEQTSARNGSHLIKKSLLLWGCATASLALTAQAIAQSTQTLPQVTVEGKGSTAKKGTAKGAPKAAPQQPAEPVQQETQATKEKAHKDAVYNTPAAVSTATRTDVETFGQLDTGDVLRSMPGTSTTGNPQNPGVAVNIRGFEGSGRVNMMIDGVRQNFRFTAHEAKGFAYVDPALLAGVDIMRGAISTAGGAGALAGAANLHAGRRRHHQARQHDRRHEFDQLRHQWGRLERNAGGEASRPAAASAWPARSAIMSRTTTRTVTADRAEHLPGSSVRSIQDGHQVVGRAKPEARRRPL